MIAVIAALALATTTAAAVTDTATPDPNATVVIEGIVVSAEHLKELFDAYRTSQSSKAIDLVVKTRPASAMPWYDPHWHYAGSSVDSSSMITAEIWLNADDVHAKDHFAMVGIAAGILLADMESGYAGPYWKNFYLAEAARDQEAAAKGDNPYVHRDNAADRIAEAIVGQ